MAAFEDLGDPAFAGVGPEKAPEAIISRCVKWVKANPKVAHLFCEHGSYVGFQRALAYRCPRCPET